MNKDIIKMFNLQGYLIDKIESKEKEVILCVRSPRNKALCPYCSNGTNKVHQRHNRRLKHSWLEDKTVILMIKKRRFYCSFCKRPFSEYLPGINRKRSSLNFRINAIKELSKSSFNNLAHKLGVSASNLVSIMHEVSALKKTAWPRKDFVLGIDEHSFRGRDLVITITDLTNRRLLAVLKSDNQSELIKFITNMPNEAKTKVIEVCIDMNRSYLKAAEKYLKDTFITIDRFHVVKEANRILDQSRSIIASFENKKYKKIPRLLLFKGKEKLTEKEKQKLKQIFSYYHKFPKMKEAWIVKEQIRELYRKNNRKEAERFLNRIINILETERIGALADLRETLKRWRPYILNYFVNKTTNAFTEGVHTKIKMIKRMSFGFRNIDNYIAKVMLSFLPLSLIIYHTI